MCLCEQKDGWMNDRGVRSKTTALLEKNNVSIFNQEQYHRHLINDTELQILNKAYG